jgi:hypothetical protein
MALEDLTPFGTLPKAYQGLLGADETAALQKRAQIQGLLGAGLALAKGMSPYGAPRSALQNILGAVAGGFESSGGAYQQGLQNFQTQQQLQQVKLQREQAVAQADAVKQLLLDPTIANDPAAVAYIRANPVEAVKEISQRRMREGELAKLRQGRVGATTQTGSMTAEIDAQIQSLRDNAQIAASQGKADQASQYITAANNLNKEKQNIAAINFDFTGLKNSVPESLKGNVDFLAKQAKDGLISGDKIFEGIQQIQTASRESAKGNLLGNEAARDYALTQFGTADITKLSQQQRDNALRYSQAANDADRVKIANDAIKLKFETGQSGGVPLSRTSFLGQNQPPVTSPSAPVATTAPVTATPAAVTTQKVDTAPKATTAQTTPVATKGVIPLIEKPDNIVPVQQKQKLIQSQPATISLANYSLDNISQQKKAAEELLNNKQYIKAITSSNLVGGYVTEQLANRPGTTAFDANNLLKNLQTRSFVSEIQRMRNASPTGGAVGSVTEKEMEGLSNIGAAIKAGMSEKELTAQLKKYIANADRALKTIPNEYSKTYRYQGEFDQYLNPNASPTAPAATGGVRKYNPATGRIE